MVKDATASVIRCSMMFYQCGVRAYFWFPFMRFVMTLFIHLSGFPGMNLLRGVCNAGIHLFLQ